MRLDVIPSRKILLCILASLQGKTRPVSVTVWLDYDIHRG